MGNREISGQNTAYVIPVSDIEMPIARGFQKREFKQNPDLERWETKCSDPEPNEDLHLRQLQSENRRLKMIIEDLTLDKLAQANRIKELQLENSQIKQVIAELTLGRQMLKRAL